MPLFIDYFDYMLIDQEFGFKMDKILLTLVLSSLRLEPNRHDKESFITINCISPSIYLIFKGKVDVYYQDNESALFYLETGSYFGDISLIFNTINQYRFDVNQKSQIYSLPNIKEIFKRFSEFARVMEIRALRRHNYFTMI